MEKSTLHIHCTRWFSVFSFIVKCTRFIVLGKGQDCLNDLYYTLDNIMKMHTNSGLGRKNSTSVVTVDAEEKMWNKGILGEDTPKQLSDTILYLLGLNLALRGGEEHHRLHCLGSTCNCPLAKTQMECIA